MDKEYILQQIVERIALLKARYKGLCHGKDETGNEMSVGAAAKARYFCKRDHNQLVLIQELIEMLPKLSVVGKSDAALAALEILLEPTERHRRLKGG